MPNGTYGGVRGKETKVGQKTFVSRPTRLTVNGVGLFELAEALADDDGVGTVGEVNDSGADALSSASVYG